MKRLVIPSAALAVGGLLITDSASTSTAFHTPSTSTMSAMSSAAAVIPAADHNDADVRFSQMMIPHHRQAVDMAGLADTRASRPQVKDLAKRIEAAQGPEIQTMSGWLRSWGMQVPSPGAMTMDHGNPGMMSEHAMKKLEGLSGAAFDKAFLEMMIQHHEGAIAMAEDEQRDGAYEPAKQLAGSIISSQSAEITTMKELLR
ncbi:DUF305 domain-containing protein [Planotetraspora phitsanulokensis]|uniref:Lipoprotein n=1 Tax=Planotetraspora phitsanulokensis TaxID=575192 RepID=A0A8J3XCF4_9ACTN|nr:DUF305 domain-containing protein [Planotetraspora phitsanulokensis]GII35960.1 lipoprotein [Planotetraspora phitsanulokensis]